MSARDFCLWLEGFLEGQNRLEPAGVKLVRERLAKAGLDEARAADARATASRGIFVDIFGDASAP